MTTKSEESTLQKVEKELAEFQQKKTNAETALKDELSKAKAEYDSLVKEIEKKHKVDEYTEDIKRHSYVLRLLKGEIAFPEDLNAKKGKVKIASNENKAPRIQWADKMETALKKMGKSMDDKPTVGEILPVLQGLYPDTVFTKATVNAKLNPKKA